MDINTLQNNIANAINDNDAVNTWCAIKYGRSPKIYIGFNSRKPPGEDDYPLVRVNKTSKTMGYDLDRAEYGVSVLCGIFAADEEELARERIIQYESIDDIESFRKLVETALVAEIESPYFISGIDVEYEGVEFYPFLLANMEVRITMDYSQGDDVFG
jgi:hypothetical protein